MQMGSWLMSKDEKLELDALRLLVSKIEETIRRYPKDASFVIGAIDMLLEIYLEDKRSSSGTVSKVD